MASSSLSQVTNIINQPRQKPHSQNPKTHCLSAGAMDRRFSREVLRESKGSNIPMQKRLAEKKLKHDQPLPQRVPDLTDLMNDMFFGTPDADKKAYDLRGDPMEEGDFDGSNRSNSSKLTQEWLEEARRLVASSPSRSDSPSRLVEGRLSVDRREPRFAADVPIKGRLSVSSIDPRDPFSRSARRQRAVVGLSEEILTKSAKHGRNTSEAPDSPTSPSDLSPASSVHKWFSNILKPSSGSPEPTSELDQTSPVLLPPRHSVHRNSISYLDQSPALLPPRLSVHRKSRFQNDPASPNPTRRTFKVPTPLPADTQLLSPPKDFVDSAPRMSISLSENRVLSPPRNLVESAHRRSISSNTCALDKIEPRENRNGLVKEEEQEEEPGLNGFLKAQKLRIEKILRGEANGKAKIVLSGPSNSTSSMVAAICYAWLLENKAKKEKAGGGGVVEQVVVPVMNFKRQKMWNHQKAAWLFHHLGLDATSLFFADEVDLESLVMAGKLSMLVVGQDVLKPNGEVGSQCTALTNKYCQEACNVLESTMLRKLLLSGIVLDTKNLKGSATVAKDKEAAQFLLVGLSPNYRTALFDQLLQDQREKTFVEALRCNYGKPPNDLESQLVANKGVHGNDTHLGHRKSTSVPHQEARVSVRKSISTHHHEPAIQHSGKNSKDARDAKPPKVLPKPAKPSPVKSSPSAGSGGKNKSILSKWFGIGSK